MHAFLRCSNHLYLAFLFIFYYSSNKYLQWQNLLSVLSTYLIIEQICSQRCLPLHELRKDCKWAAVRWDLPWKSAKGSEKWTTNATSFQAVFNREKKKKISSWKEWKKYSLQLQGKKNWWLLFFFWVQLARCLVDVLVWGMLWIFCMLVVLDLILKYFIFSVQHAGNWCTWYSLGRGRSLQVTDL